MKEEYSTNGITVRNGDCLELIKAIPDNSISSIITDPPYEIGFLGRAWDKSGIAFSPELWAECLRVLKPGGHVVCFGATRTVHRVAVAIEDAGFEIRDQFSWIYTSGMIKGSEITKALDARISLGDIEAKKIEFVNWAKKSIKKGVKQSEVIATVGTTASHFFYVGQPAIPSQSQWEQMKHFFDEPTAEILELINYREEMENNLKSRKVTGVKSIADGIFESENSRKNAEVSESVNESVLKWSGYRPSLAPRTEPAVIARKPFRGSIADNIINHSAGALNIDGNKVNDRLPGNVASDADYFEAKAPNFLLSSKAPASERHKHEATGKSHPTVKPQKLMQHLVSIFTPEGGVVLDPFAGSGSTLVACREQGREAIGFELEHEFYEIIKNRIALI